MTECILCELAVGTAERSLVVEDPTCVAVMDHAPVNPGHVLVIPREHLERLADTDEPTGAHLFTIATRAAASIRRSPIRCEGVNLFLADGEAAGQEIDHVHLHVVPRFAGDPFRIARDGGWVLAEREHLDRTAADLREAWA